MAFRFFRRFRLLPGVTVNLSKRGFSLSGGPRGMKVTAGRSGVRRTISVPGTGLWYTEHLGRDSGGSGRSRGGRRRPTGDRRPPPPPADDVPPEARLSLGFFQRLFTPSDEKSLVEAMRRLVQGEYLVALREAKQAAHLADGAFMAGFLSIHQNRPAEAEKYLKRALKQHQRLGHYFTKYEVEVTLALGITESVAAQIGPRPRGVMLALARICEARGKWDEAVALLRRLRRLMPHDPVVRVALAELLLDDERSGGKQWQAVVRLAKEVENESTVHAALLLCKGRALHRLGLHTAARDALTAAYRRKKDRPGDLLRTIRYERALVYEALGRTSRARREFEGIYAEDPDFEDVAARLGVA